MVLCSTISNRPRVQLPRIVQSRFTCGFGPRTLSGLSRAIEARADLSLSEFQQSYFEQKPVIMKRYFIDLPAVKKWHSKDHAHLKRYGTSMIPVEITQGDTTYASDEGSSHFEQVEIPLIVFLDALKQVSNAPSTKSENEVRMYLAQHSLFDSIPDLYRDVCLPSFVKCSTNDRLVPEFAVVKHGDIYNINAWIGLSTHTPLHKDPYHNIFVQLSSYKKVIIFPPTVHETLQLHTDPLLKNNSRIKDVFEPQQRNALGPKVLSSAFEATIETGDGLYIPQGWLHSFKGALGVSSSVNWWFR